MPDGSDAAVDAWRSRAAPPRRSSCRCWASACWRFEQPGVRPQTETEVVPVADAQGSQPRIVRADTYLAVAALEDHIASIDEALERCAPRWRARPKSRGWSARGRCWWILYAMCVTPKW